MFDGFDPISFLFLFLSPWLQEMILGYAIFFLKKTKSMNRVSKFSFYCFFFTLNDSKSSGSSHRNFYHNAWSKFALGEKRKSSTFGATWRQRVRPPISTSHTIMKWVTSLSSNSQCFIVQPGRYSDNFGSRKKANII